MALTKCKYCEHGNPPDSKYCNACGGILTLAPCPHCGAVSEVTATTCYQCGGSLQESSKDAIVPALPAAPISRPSLRQPSLAIVGTVVVAIVAFIGYYAYRHYSLVSLPPSSAANTEAKGRSGPVEPASTPGPAATPTVSVIATPTSAVSPAGAIPAPPTPPATPQMTERRASRQPVEPSAAAVAAPVARPQTTNGGTAGELGPPRLGPCTERVAALGLCTPKPVPKNEAETAAAVPAAVVARPQTNNGGEPCAEALAALGLCTPKSK